MKNFEHLSNMNRSSTSLELMTMKKRTSNAEHGWDHYGSCDISGGCTNEYHSWREKKRPRCLVDGELESMTDHSSFRIAEDLPISSTYEESMSDEITGWSTSSLISSNDDLPLLSTRERRDNYLNSCHEILGIIYI